jgi:hypothetical protein
MRRLLQTILQETYKLDRFEHEIRDTKTKR